MWYTRQWLKIDSRSNMASLYLVLFLAAVSSATPLFGKTEYALTPVGASVDKASMKILKETFDGAENKNLVSSPVGALVLLNMYSEGTDKAGSIRKEILGTLGYDNFDKYATEYGQLTKNVNTEKADVDYFTAANKIYVDAKFKVNKEFSLKSQVVPETVDFADSTAAAAVINKWAEQKTHGNIKNAVNADSLPKETAVALFNVIYFKGHWGVPFKVEDTEEDDFHVTKDKTVKKTFMHVMRSLFYYNSPVLGAQLAELPYKEEGFRMIVVLPNEIDGLPSVLEKASQGGILDEVYKMHPAGRDVCLMLPKFKIESEFDLKPILSKFGVPSLFTEGAPGVVEGQQVKVAKAFQKASLTVDEEGSTASAFTGLVAVPMSSLSKAPTPILFHADRPFLYLILYKDIVIFTGTYAN